MPQVARCAGARSCSSSVGVPRGLIRTLPTHQGQMFKPHYKRHADHRPVSRTTATSGFADQPGQSKDEGAALSSTMEEVVQEPPKPAGLGQRIKRFFVGDKLDKDRLAKLGLGAVASYGFISNLTYGTGMAVAWIAFVKQLGKSPLMAGQWPTFLAFYAGFWTVQNFVRPLRFSVALAMAPFFDRFIGAIQNKFGISRRNAFGVYLFILGSVTSIGVFGSIATFAGPLAFART